MLLRSAPPLETCVVYSTGSEGCAADLVCGLNGLTQWRTREGSVELKFGLVCVPTTETCRWSGDTLDDGIPECACVCDAAFPGVPPP